MGPKWPAFFDVWGKIERAMKSETQRRVEDVAGAVCRQHGCELFFIELIEAGKHSVLRVYIDREDGVRIGDCEVISDSLSTVLDVEDLIPYSYHLEVSSPGLDRPLRGPDDFMQYVGRKIKIVTKKPVGDHGQTTFIGNLLSYEKNAATVETHKGSVQILQDNVKRANLQFKMQDRDKKMP